MRVQRVDGAKSQPEGEPGKLNPNQTQNRVKKTGNGEVKTCVNGRRTLERMDAELHGKSRNHRTTSVKCGERKNRDD